MFKLYSEISTLGRFTNGHLTEFIDFIDSMQWFEVDGGVAYICPEKTDYYFGHSVNLYAAPADDVVGETLTTLWDAHLLEKASKAHKRVVVWASEPFIDYKNIGKEYNHQCEVLLKYSPTANKISRPTYNVKKITADDFTQMADIYVADSGEVQRGFIEWMIGNRMDAIAAGVANFFVIWNRDRGEIASIAGLYWKDGVYRYASVATRKAYRGRGYASALIAHIRDYALERGAKEIYIMAENGSQAASIYKKTGFEINSYMYSIVSDR